VFILAKVPQTLRMLRLPKIRKSGLSAN